MPTVLRAEGFEVVIRTDDHEPPHVQLYRSGMHVKIWLDPVKVAERRSMRARDSALARALVARNQALLLAKWREIHG